MFLENSSMGAWNAPRYLVPGGILFPWTRAIAIGKMNGCIAIFRRAREHEIVQPVGEISIQLVGVVLTLTLLKYLTKERYVHLLVEYFDFDRRKVRAWILLFFFPSEMAIRATWASLWIGNDVNIVKSSSVRANFPQAQETWVSVLHLDIRYSRSAGFDPQSFFLPRW